MFREKFSMCLESCYCILHPVYCIVYIAYSCILNYYFHITLHYISHNAPNTNRFYAIDYTLGTTH